MSHHDGRAVRYRLSGVNLEWTKKVGIIGGAVVIVLLVVFLSIPTKYIFRLSSGGELSLCVSRIGWFDAVGDRFFEPVYFGKDRDEMVNDLLSKRFKTREEALAALQPVALHRLHARLQALEEVEQSLAEQYHRLLGEYRAAQQTGVNGLELPVEALQRWLEMYRLRAEMVKVSAQGSAPHTTPPTPPVHR